MMMVGSMVGKTEKGTPRTDSAVAIESPRAALRAADVAAASSADETPSVTVIVV